MTDPLPVTAPMTVDHLPVEVLPISSLFRGDSPRLSGEDGEHVRALAQMGDRLPPILVHRPTMRVIDGMHRLRAAMLRGDLEIEARCFDGDTREAFVLAVRSNTTHGLPLTLADRSAAAARILRSHPHWSDRAVAAATGLAAATAGAIRQRGAENSSAGTRVGLDGRARPLSSADGRRIASTMFVKSPGVSLREVARAAGISPATAQNVRDRLRRGEDPVPTKQRAAEPTGASSNGACPNGASSNGVSLNGASSNGASSNGASSNGVSSNGASSNGVSSNGASSNGYHPNGGGSIDPKLEGAARAAPTLKGRRPSMKPATVLRGLRSDPSLRFNEDGRELLVWLARHVLEPEECAGFLDHVPTHSTSTVAELARACAQIWGSFADELEQRSRAAGLMEPGRI